MDNTNIELILENLVQTMPVLHKKFIKLGPVNTAGNLTRLHFAIMGILSEGSVAVTELARMLAVPKSQMTHLINHLVVLGIVERLPDTKDRRVINLVLTEQGLKIREDMKREIHERIKERLSILTPEEQAEMLAALKILRDIAAKL